MSLLGVDVIKKNWIRITFYGCFVLLLVSCNAVGSPALPDEKLAVPASTLPVTETLTEPEMTQSAHPPGMESLIEKAREDLAQRLSISVSQIKLIEAKAVTWPDASLGCPQPDMVYIQVPQDGALIVLQAEGNIYEYHNGGSRGLFLCEKGFLKTEKPPQIDITDLTPDNSIPPGEDQ